MFAAELCRSWQICFHYWIGVVRSESGVCCWIVYFVANQVCTVELCCLQWSRCSLPNWCCPRWIRCERIKCSLPNLYCPQRIRCPLLNCVVHSELGVRCRIGVVRSESGVCCRIGVVRSESGVSELGVRCRIVLSVANQILAAEIVLSPAN